MKKSTLFFVVCLCIFGFTPLAHAEIEWSGDVDPADPTTWDSDTTGYIGKTGYGTMDVTSGSDVLNYSGYIGFQSDSTGEVTVDGTSSTWTNGRNLHVGSSGGGTLNITGGGAVSNSYGYIGYIPGSEGVVVVDGANSIWTSTYDLRIGYFGSGMLDIMDGGAVTVNNDTLVSCYSGSLGTIHFDNGTLTTGALGCSFDDLTGTGTINTNGLVSDVDLIFDATHGLNKTFNINNNPGQNITLNLNVDGSGSMGAGYSGAGTMSIFDGKVVESTMGYIGYNSGSIGVVTVDGGGSIWNSSDLYVGFDGSGTLNITGGGEVSNEVGCIGLYSESTGMVTVDGDSSIWTNTYGLIVGDWGSGMLDITDGGMVNVAETLIIDSFGIGDSFINMAGGGMLALFGDADDSLVDFLGLMIGGTDAIRYWDDSVSDWADITGATYGVDYTLEYLTEGELTGYTMLTVPEPTTLLLLGLGGLVLRRRK